MKKTSILINKEELEINSFFLTPSEYIYDYIDYKLYPYKKLGLFSYNTFLDNENPLDGARSPSELINHIRQLACIKSNPNNSFITLSSFCNFFNASSGRFYLTPEEYTKLLDSPKNFCIVFSYLHR